MITGTVVYAASVLVSVSADNYARSVNSCELAGKRVAEHVVADSRRRSETLRSYSRSGHNACSSSLSRGEETQLVRHHDMFSVPGAITL